MEVKANLFLVGAMKAGTTSLVEILGAQSEVYVSAIKEPHFFVSEMPKALYEESIFFDEASYFKKDFPKPIHIANLQNVENYAKLFENGSTFKYRLDASTAYLHAPDVVSKIKAYNPEAKIIISVRNPLDRAFSHYKMDKGLGRTTKSFDALISSEIESYHNGTLAWHSYLGMSFYKRAIERFQESFNEVLVLEFDTFIQNSEETLQKLASFLEIDTLSVAEASHKNKTRSLKFQKLFFLLKKLGLKDYFSKLVPHATKQKLFKMVSTEAKEEMALSEETQQELEKIFQKESI